MAVDHKKFQFPSLTTDEAVANCKSMFGSQVALTADDFVRPQVSLCQNFSYVIDSMNSKISLSNNFPAFPVLFRLLEVITENHSLSKLLD